MMDPAAQFRAAIDLHRAGRVAEAATAYRQMLAQFPGHGPLLDLLGTAEVQLGHAADGVAHLREALRVLGPQPQVLSHLGSGLQATGRLGEALGCFDKAIAAHPGFVEALYNRTNVLIELKRHAEALKGLDHLLTLAPQHVSAQYNRATLLGTLGREEEALAAYDRLLSLIPQMTEARLNRAQILQRQGRRTEALADYDAVLAAEADTAEAWGKSGALLIDMQRAEEAVSRLTRAIAFAPGNKDHWNNRGLARQALQQADDALADFAKAAELAPDFAIAPYNRGNLLAAQMRLPEAIACFHKARTLKPDFAQAAWNEGLARLLSGDFAEGWPLYEWRWKNPDLPQPDWLGTVAQWQGEDLKGRTLIIRPDQGFGDYVQFCRLAQMALAQGAHVIVSAPAPLVRLLASLEGVSVVAEGTPLPQDGLQVPLLRLPGLFAICEENIPTAPYLTADPALREAVHTWLGPKTRPRIGLAVSGSATLQNDANRSIPLHCFAPLLALPYDFYLVQQGLRASDEAAATANLHQPPLGDFADTAALIAEMDLTLSVDTAPAHVAGAIGAPVWILLPFAPDWRWMTARCDSPWYPTAELFRQPARGDWASVLTELTTHLQKRFDTP